MLSRTLADIKSLFFFRKPICRCSRLFSHFNSTPTKNLDPPDADTPYFSGSAPMLSQVQRSLSRKVQC
ncbi:hypothetical protein BHE90_007236 [Fusarium euwallaceae]|uniref:Uncharacterized protein n=2 Tax=Fusarium solani species complex TaxID=232080 RepID=A0A430LRB7_9HYPO|nr:hypothetical protein CEP51_011975 [Fusarium floridanum]RTE78276.1 hypothetical protein BHE90_007236 [Fusarium euwallaceae]